MLSQGIENNQLAPSIQFFVDSPMAITATEIFARHLDDLKPEAVRLFQKHRDPRAARLALYPERTESSGAEHYIATA